MTEKKPLFSFDDEAATGRAGCGCLIILVCVAVVTVIFAIAFVIFAHGWRVLGGT